MRILYISRRPPYPFFLGGAARCAHVLLAQMSAEFDAHCTAVGSKEYSVAPWHPPDQSEYISLGIKSLDLVGDGYLLDCGYPVRIFPDFFNALGGFMESFKPDIVWAQLEGAREILELAHERGFQGLLYVHDAEFKPTELRAIADLNCHIVCSSRFLADKVRKVIGRKAWIVHPASEWYFDTEGDPNGYVTMINPFQVKGIDTFLEIAQRLPLENFLLLESWKLNDTALAELEARLTQVRNVRFQRRVPDMRSIYGQTKLLLVPSVWEEGFGMVAVEAQSCRIPVIASARGGLPESVGDGGILIQDYRNVEEWVNAINEVLRDSSMYRELSNRAFCHASSADFQPTQLARRFLEACTADVDRPSAYVRGMRTVKNRLERMPILGRFFHEAD